MADQVGGAIDTRKRVSAFIVLIIALPVAIVLAVTVGKFDVSVLESARVLLAGLTGNLSSPHTMTENVVMGVRVPRILASVIVGAALSMSGAAFQGAFKNPLVSPDFLGVFSGAAVGASIAILLSLTTVYMSIFAFVGGIVTVMITMSIPAAMRNQSNIMLVLSGIIVGAAMSSVLGFIKYIADPYTELASITYWMMGSFAYISMREILVLLPFILIPAVILISMSWWVDILSMGEDEAQTLGADVRKVRGLTIVCATLMTSASVCMAGTIGWIALVVPHFGRLLVGPSNRFLIPFSALVGAMFMLIVDTATRVIGVTEMPVSILTGIIGAPFYIWLLIRQRRAF